MCGISGCEVVCNYMISEAIHMKKFSRSGVELQAQLIRSVVINQGQEIVGKDCGVSAVIQGGRSRSEEEAGDGPCRSAPRAHPSIRDNVLVELNVQLVPSSLPEAKCRTNLCRAIARSRYPEAQGRTCRGLEPAREYYRVPIRTCFYKLSNTGYQQAADRE